MKIDTMSDLLGSGHNPYGDPVVASEIMSFHDLLRLEYDHDDLVG